MNNLNKRVVFDIETKEVVPFKVRVIKSGDEYGLNDQLIHDGNEPLIEFFDKRYPHTENGQFVSRYSLSTIVNRNDDGLWLDGGVKEWTISKEGMNFVLEKLNEVIPNEVNSYKEKVVNKVKMRYN